MAGLRDSLASLQKMRRLFLRRIAAAASESASPLFADAPTLLEITKFGNNPGSLRMFAHVPERTASNPALVVALHGCTQSARDYAFGSGWSDLADQKGFIVIYPEQHTSNNPKSCFSWYLPADTARGSGEALSIRQMIEKAVSEFDIDQRRIFITGLSAGGAMASVMLAAYPEVFAGGAIIGGLPYGSATNVQEAFDAMFNDRAPSARALGDRVRAASRHSGPWPRISVWHGTADAVVKQSNAEHIISQWLNVQGLQREPSELEQGASYTRRVWTNRNGQPALEAVSVAGMGHGVPIATTGRDAFGTAGPFFLDAGVSSTTHIARFWELEFEIGERAAAAEAPYCNGGSVPAQFASSATWRSDGTEQEDDRAQTSASPFNPSEVIAAAFKSAGLPQPGNREGPDGNKLDPSAIIAAALKAAGLSR